MLLADDNIVKICDFGLAKDIYKYQEYQKQTDVSRNILYCDTGELVTLCSLQYVAKYLG